MLDSKSIHTGLCLLTASALLAGCSFEKPIPADLAALASPTNSLFVGHKIILAGNSKLEGSFVGSSWYQPPPIMMPCGKSFIFIPQAGYNIDTTYFKHSVTVADSAHSYTWSPIVKTSPIPDGNCHVIGKFNGMLNGVPQLGDIEIVQAAR